MKERSIRVAKKRKIDYNGENNYEEKYKKNKKAKKKHYLGKL